jgi:L-lactate dehydrogenase complex protein LldE
MTVQLFATCLIDSLFPEVGEAVVTVLRHLGLRLEFPPNQTCCGQPAFNAGYHAEARRMAQHTIEVFTHSQAPVIIPSGSCTAMIRHGYLELFADDPIWLPKAQQLSERCFEFSEYLVDQLGVTAIGPAYPLPVAYHPGCHTLRGLGVDRQPLALLESVCGAGLQRLPADCCGFGGVFAVDHEPISSELLQRRLAQIEESNARVVVACDVSCLMHLEGGLRKAGSPLRCAHIAQVLAGQEAGLR